MKLLGRLKVKRWGVWSEEGTRAIMKMLMLQKDTSLWVRACMLSPLCIWLFAMPPTVAHQAPLSTEFSRWDYWSGLPFPTPYECSRQHKITFRNIARHLNRFYHQYVIKKNLDYNKNSFECGDIHNNLLMKRRNITNSSYLKDVQGYYLKYSLK